MLNIKKTDTGLHDRAMQPDYEIYKKYISGELKADAKIAPFLHLCKGKLDSVWVQDALQPESGGWESLNGKSISTINFKFSAIDKKLNENTFYTYSIGTPDPKGMFKKSGKPSIKANVDSMIGYTTHFSNILLSGLDLNLDLPTNKKGYLDVDAVQDMDVDTIISAFAAFFKSIEKGFYKGTGDNAVLKCKDTDINIKLTVQTKDKGQFGFNVFTPGTGVIELYDAKAIVTSLQLDPRYDTIIPQDMPTVTAPVINNQGMPDNIASAMNNL